MVSIMYQQIDGISKGNPLDLILANIFVIFLEEWLFDEVHLFVLLGNLC